MQVICNIKQMQKIIAELDKNKTVGMVPTMGFLHAGHLSLVRLAQKKADITIVSIFVNPTQFGPNEDFKRYPRDEKGDLKKLHDLEVDYVFIPKASAMYPADFQTEVSVKELTKPLCGRSRPGHFNGVMTVVNKLFNIIKPDFAVFGQKDFQQLLSIKKMVVDLNIPIQIVAAPIVRENDKLAMSSRNVYLSKEQRKDAPNINNGLTAVKRACLQKKLSVGKMKEIFLKALPKRDYIRVDYVECLDVNDLTEITSYKKGHTLMAVAVFFGKTRLIDNRIF